MAAVWLIILLNGAVVALSAFEKKKKQFFNDKYEHGSVYYFVKLVTRVTRITNPQAITRKSGLQTISFMHA